MGCTISRTSPSPPPLKFFHSLPINIFHYVLSKQFSAFLRIVAHKMKSFKQKYKIMFKIHYFSQQLGRNPYRNNYIFYILISYQANICTINESTKTLTSEEKMVEHKNVLDKNSSQQDTFKNTKLLPRYFGTSGTPNYSGFYLTVANKQDILSQERLPLFIEIVAEHP